MREVSSSGANGSLQATIFKKCSREFHRPESNKGCANGTWQHTCEASGAGKRAPEINHIAETNTSSVDHAGSRFQRQGQD